MSELTAKALELAAMTPTDFIFGAATSSWQIEGNSSSRGASIWDDFANAGRIKDGALADPACNHVLLYQTDLDLLSWLNVDAYRFSVSWPRVIPTGSGKASAVGLDFYDKLIDGLLARNIKPSLTIYHWDLPVELEAMGGWTWDGISESFSEYTNILAEKFSDRIDFWSTLNEPWVSAFLGYATAIHAPGRNDAASWFRAAYNLMLAHGKSLQVLREHNVKNAGTVLNLTSIIATSELAAAQEHIDILQNRFWLDLLAGRGVSPVLVENTKHILDWDFVDQAELDCISKPIDWLGINYYTPTRLGMAAPASAAVGQDLALYPGTPQPISFNPLPPTTEMGWEIDASSLLTTLQQTSARLPNTPLYITENGGAFPDHIIDGKVLDFDRVDYFYTHIKTALEAVAQGIDLKGYFAWSLLDNIEWAEGISKKFGIIHNDFSNQKRTPKLSAEFLRELNLGRKR